MNAETFATWLRRQGRHVYRTASSYWYDAAPRVLQAFPYHRLITPEANETRDLMWQHGIIALRYSTPFGFPDADVSYHVVVEEPYELEMLKPQARGAVRCGLAHFKIEQISFERLATDGWALQQDTLRRQGRLSCMTQQEWERLCHASIGLTGFEAWGATSEGELAGAVIICRIDDVFNVPYALSHSRFLSDHVNNALFFCTTREMLGRAGVTGVFYTVQSLDAPPTVDEFKFRMGLRARAVGQRVDFHPLLNPFVTQEVHTWVSWAARRVPANALLAKAEGMVRIHVDSKRPVGEQAWPQCVAAEKESWLEDLAGMQRTPEKLNQSREVSVPDLDACQLPGVPRFSTGIADPGHQPAVARIKGWLAKPWNIHVKKWLKQAYYSSARWRRVSSARAASDQLTAAVDFAKGDQVRVRSRAEITSTLDPFKELKGCAFLPQMYQYCGTQQRVLRSMQRFMDERDYKLKKVHGVVLLENIMCNGTATFGACDRCCFLFWREEWLEPLEPAHSN